MVANADKLAQIVELLAEVQTVLDGGWYYSSPLIRNGLTTALAAGPLVTTPDALSIVAAVVADTADVATYLMRLAERATNLEVDVLALCNADLTLLSRVYLKLSQDISTAANEAVDALRPTEKPEAPRRRARQSKSSAPSSSQTSLGGLDTERVRPIDTDPTNVDDNVQGD